MTNTPLPDLMRAALMSVREHDKAATRQVLGAANRRLPQGPHPLRVKLHAIDCAVDISNWALAQEYATQALRQVSANQSG